MSEFSDSIPTPPGFNYPPASEEVSLGSSLGRSSSSVSSTPDRVGQAASRAAADSKQASHWAGELDQGLLHALEGFKQMNSSMRFTINAALILQSKSIETVMRAFETLDLNQEEGNQIIARFSEGPHKVQAAAAWKKKQEESDLARVMEIIKTRQFNNIEKLNRWQWNFKSSYIVIPDPEGAKFHVYKSVKNVIGKGAYAVVHKMEAMTKDSEPMIRGKMLGDESDEKFKTIEAFQNECDSPQILRYRFLNYYSKSHHKKIAKLARYLEGGDLHSCRMNGVEEVKKRFRQIAAVVKHVSDNGWVHDDIKPANLFLDKLKDCVVLGDPDLVTREKDVKLEEKALYRYWSPERKGWGGKIDPKKIDVYSTGITFLELLARTEQTIPEESRLILQKLINELQTIEGNSELDSKESARSEFLAIADKLLSGNPSDFVQPLRDTASKLLFWGKSEDSSIRNQFNELLTRMKTTNRYTDSLEQLIHSIDTEILNKLKSLRQELLQPKLKIQRMDSLKKWHIDFDNFINNLPRESDELKFLLGCIRHMIDPDPKTRFSPSQVNELFNPQPEE